MKTKDEYKPETVLSPMVTLMEKLSEIGLTFEEFCDDINELPNYVRNVLECREPNDFELDLELGSYLGVPSSFWVRKINRYTKFLKEKRNAERKASKGK